MSLALIALLRSRVVSLPPPALQVPTEIRPFHGDLRPPRSYRHRSCTLDCRRSLPAAAARLTTPSAAELSSRALRWRFGETVFDGRLLELTVAGEPVRLEPKPLELLLYLLRHSGEVVTKEELHEQPPQGAAGLARGRRTPEPPAGGGGQRRRKAHRPRPGLVTTGSNI
jgi:hypothetical protein